MIIRRIRVGCEARRILNIRCHPAAVFLTVFRAALCVEQLALSRYPMIHAGGALIHMCMHVLRFTYNKLISVLYALYLLHPQCAVRDCCAPVDGAITTTRLHAFTGIRHCAHLFVVTKQACASDAVAAYSCFIFDTEIRKKSSEQPAKPARSTCKE